jgi:hypothetical protein
MKPQRRHTLLLLTFWEAAVIRSARAATKTFPTAQIPPTGEGAAPGLGETLDAAPHAGLAWQDLITKPALILSGGGKEMSARGCAGQSPGGVNDDVRILLL